MIISWWKKRKHFFRRRKLEEQFGKLEVRPSVPSVDGREILWHKKRIIISDNPLGGRPGSNQRKRSFWRRKLEEQFGKLEVRPSVPSVDGREILWHKKRIIISDNPLGGRPGSNRRPSVPQTDALTNWATTTIKSMSLAVWEAQSWMIQRMQRYIIYCCFINYIEKKLIFKKDLRDDK